MSSLKVQQIKGKLLEEFKPHIDQSDIGSRDKEAEQKILSRCLAAYAICYQSGCSPEDAAKAIWDGADDNGIDAAYFDASESRIVLVQAKWITKGSGEPDAGGIRAFVSGAQAVIENDASSFHDRLQARLANLTVRLNTPGTSIHLVVVSTGESTLARHGARELEGFIGELNDEDVEPIASFDVMGLREVYSGLANGSRSSTVVLDATLTDWSYVAMPYPAYVGTIDGFQLKGWWRAHGRSLVSANIRNSLGNTEVNSEIRNTALGAPERFWYYNNGITLVAESAAKAPASASSRSAGVFRFTGGSIVNGAQTISSLAKVDSDECLGRVKVSIRVILLQDAPPNFGNEVTRTNNLQNRIESRDFVAQDQEQHRIHQEMKFEGIDYSFVRSDDVSQSDTSCELIEVTTALACASGDPGLAVQVKTGIGRFFLDLKRAPYKQLFNAQTSGARAFNATLVLREIERWIDDAKRSASKRSGPKWGTLVHGNRILASSVFAVFGDARLNTPVSTFRTNLAEYSREIAVICARVHAAMVGSIESRYPSKFLAVLFKNHTACKAIQSDATSAQ